MPEALARVGGVMGDFGIMGIFGFFAVVEGEALGEGDWGEDLREGVAGGLSYK